MIERDLFGEPVWQHPMHAPQNGKEFWAEDSTGKLVVAHWASDLSGEEQPPFQGFFKWNGCMYQEILIKRWVPTT